MGDKKTVPLHLDPVNIVLYSKSCLFRQGLNFKKLKILFCHNFCSKYFLRDLQAHFTQKLPFCLISSDELPTITLNSPGSTTCFICLFHSFSSSVLNLN